MTTITEGKAQASFIMNEDPGNRSREAITIASGEGVVAPGTALGKIAGDTGAVTVGAPTFVGTGAGALTKATPAYGAGVKEGDYKITCVEAATGGGSFIVEDPDGINIGSALEGAGFDGVIKFQIDAAGADYVAGDQYTLAVSIANAATMGKYKVAKPAATDGSQNAVALNIYGVDATSADVAVAAIVRDAQVNGNEITYAAEVDDAPKKAAMIASLNGAGIIVR
jgi:Bacteriophage lambda head decoration protein D